MNRRIRITTALWLGGLVLAGIAVHADPPDAVTFPNSDVAFIIGPLIRTGSPSHPWTWYDDVALRKGLQHIQEFPEPPGEIASPGTVSLVNGSPVVVGSGTQFRTTFSRLGTSGFTGYMLLVRLASGARLSFNVQSVESDTQLTLTQTYVATGASPVSGLSYAPASIDDVWQYEGHDYYYDLSLTQWINFYRTGDVRFRDGARSVEEKVWRFFLYDSGQRMDFPLSPREAALDGLMLRALDGHPEMWIWITGYVRQHYDTWLGLRLNYSTLWYGVREGGYMLRFCAELAKVHPDAAVREEFRQKAIDAAVLYFARLQYPDGSWRWQDDAWDKDGAGNSTFHAMPFHTAILLEGMIRVHQFREYGIPITDEELRIVKESIVKSVDEIYREYLVDAPITDMPGLRWRSMPYAYYGNDGSPICYWGCPAGTGGDLGSIYSSRQGNVLPIHSFGYAYRLTGNPKYKTWGDELFDSTFKGSDGFSGYADAGRKEYDQSYRTSGSYLFWRLGPAPSSPVVQPTNSNPLHTIRVQPNPWRSDRHSGGMVWESIPDGLTISIRIFTVSGHPVREEKVNGTRWTWDLNDRSGKHVASGLYLYSLEDTAGNKKRGKVAIVR